MKELKLPPPTHRCSRAIVDTDSTVYQCTLVTGHEGLHVMHIGANDRNCSELAAAREVVAAVRRVGLIPDGPTALALEAYDRVTKALK